MQQHFRLPLLTKRDSDFGPTSCRNASAASTASPTVGGNLSTALKVGRYLISFSIAFSASLPGSMPNFCWSISACCS